MQYLAITPPCALLAIHYWLNITTDLTRLLLHADITTDLAPLLLHADMTGVVLALQTEQETSGHMTKCHESSSFDPVLFSTQ